MTPPWWAWPIPAGAGLLARASYLAGAGELAWRSRGRRQAGAEVPEPGRGQDTVPFPAPGRPGIPPDFTIPQEVRLRALSDWLWQSGHGARGLAAELADRMERALPGVPETAMATVLVEVLAFVEDAEREQVSARDALLVIKDSLRGAAPIIAAPALGLEPEGGRRR
jgi:hypothetical protein